MDLTLTYLMTQLQKITNDYVGSRIETAVYVTKSAQLQRMISAAQGEVKVPTPTPSAKRLGKKRQHDCECTYNFSCRSCLNAGILRGY